MRCVVAVRMLIVLVAACCGSFAPAQQPAGGGTTVSGTLLRLVPPQTVVIKTDDGEEKSLVIESTWDVQVFMPVEVDALPDGTPCRVMYGSMNAATQVINANQIRVQTPQSGNRPGRIRLMSASEMEFDAVPGLLRKITPLSFQVGTCPYVVPTGMPGQYTAAPRQQQNTLFNRTLPLAHRLTDGKVTAEYDFGKDWRLAGANALVVLRTPPPPGRPVLRVQRTEALPAGK